MRNRLLEFQKDPNKQRSHMYTSSAPLFLRFFFVVRKISIWQNKSSISQNKNSNKFLKISRVFLKIRREFLKIRREFLKRVLGVLGLYNFYRNFFLYLIMFIEEIKIDPAPSILPMTQHRPYTLHSYTIYRFLKIN